jgi:hypothetical protein
MMEVPDKETEIAHRWQAFRMTCLELAVKAGATHENIIDVANKLGTYILEKSEHERTAKGD